MAKTIELHLPLPHPAQQRVIHQANRFIVRLNIVLRKQAN